MVPKQFSTSFVTPANVTFTTQATGYEASYLLSNVSHPVTRHWRSTVTTQTDLFFDLGGSKSIAAIILLGANFTSVQAARSTTLGGTYTDITGSPFTITKRAWGGYYHRIIIVSWTDSFCRIRIPAQTPVTGEAYFKLGAVLFVSSLTMLVLNARPGMGMTIVDPQTESGDDMSPAGPLYAQHDWQQIYQSSEMTPFWDMMTRRRHQPVLWYDPTGNTFENVWLARFSDSISMRVENGNAGEVRYEVSPRMKELV